MNPNTSDPDLLTVPHLAEQAAETIRTLNHRTRPCSDALTDPLDAAETIAALARLASRLPQLFDQLAGWVQSQQHAGRLRLDPSVPEPDPAHTVHALTATLQQAIHSTHRAAHALDTAHQHIAHLAATDETDNRSSRPATARGRNSCRSMGPSHLTRRICR